MTVRVKICCIASRDEAREARFVQDRLFGETED